MTLRDALAGVGALDKSTREIAARTLHDHILSLAKRLAHAPIEPDDVAQNAFIKIVNRFKSISHETTLLPENPDAYIRMVVKNVVADVYRKSPKTVSLDQIEGAYRPDSGTNENAPATLLIREHKSTLNRVFEKSLAGLMPRYRDAHRKSYDEIWSLRETDATVEDIARGGMTAEPSPDDVWRERNRIYKAHQRCRDGLLNTIEGLADLPNPDLSPDDLLLARQTLNELVRCQRTRREKVLKGGNNQ